MNFISHRVNTIEALDATDQEYGVEVDIRSHGSRLVIHHDPFTHGVSFQDWLSHYRHGTLILNVKEEGLEERLIGMMSTHGIDDSFFLDQSFPFMIKWASASGGRSAVRVSEFESVETALSLANIVSWVWVDCFTRFPLDSDEAKQLKTAGFKLCLVSPELHGRDLAGIEIMARELLNKDIEIDAICSKKPEIWQDVLNCK